MNFEDLKKLRKEICLNSMYISDFNNSLGYTPESVSDLFELYVDFIYDTIRENREDDNMFDEYDNDTTLREWWEYNDFEDVLVKVTDEYIADKYYDGLTIEETEYDAGDGDMQPCFKVYDREYPGRFVRIEPLYFVWSEALSRVEIFDNEWDGYDDLRYEWREMGKDLAYKIAKIYL